jgi:hypothetical protein
VNAGVLELLERDHSVLPRRDSGDDGISGILGDFCMHGDA